MSAPKRKSTSMGQGWALLLLLSTSCLGGMDRSFFNLGSHGGSTGGTGGTAGTTGGIAATTGAKATAGSTAGTTGGASTGGTAGTAGTTGTSGGVWQSMGPFNMGDVAVGSGRSGTCADAVAAASDFSIMYQGGQNNAAASGVLKTTDGGAHWLPQNQGLADTRIRAILLDTTNVSTLYVATPSGIFRSNDAAATWQQEVGVSTIGEPRTLAWVSVAGAQWLMSATDRGLAWRASPTSVWQLATVPGAATPAVYQFSAALPTATSTTLYATIDSGNVYSILATANGVTFTQTAGAFNTVAVAPHNPLHIIGSAQAGGTFTPYNIIQSTDGGKTFSTLNTQLAWYLAFDPSDATDKTIWTGGQGGPTVSRDGGATFTQATMQLASREGYTYDAISDNDVQHLMMSFGGGIAFCSDQGLARYNAANNTFISLTGDIKNTIVVSAAVIHANATTPFIVANMWDWGPLASWNGGTTWPAGASSWWTDNTGNGAPGIGEGGSVMAVQQGNVVLFGDTSMFYSKDGGQHFITATLPTYPTNDQLNGFTTHSFTSATGAPGTVPVVWVLATETTGLWLYMSTDLGHTWSRVGSALAAGVTQVVAQPGNPNVIFSSSPTCIRQSVNGGATWSACQTLPANAGQVLQLTARADTPTTLVALTASSNLVRTVDAGAHWTMVSPQGLVPGIPGVLLEYSQTGGKLALVSANHTAGTVSKNISLSTDDGNTWTNITSNLYTVQFNEIDWDGQDLYVASSGQGLLKYIPPTSP